MSKAEILAELPNLPPQDRAEIQSKIEELAINETSGWFDADDPLTDRDKALIHARLDDLDKYPENTIPWPKAEAHLKTRFGE